MIVHCLNVVTHIAAGAAALGVGAIALVTAKGAALHRRAGRGFVASGAIVLTTAAVGELFFNAPAALLAASLASGYQYCSGIRALNIRERGPGWLDALLALAGLAGCAAMAVSMAPGTASWTPAIGYSALGYAGAVALYDLSRHLWRRAWVARARSLDHGLKMTGAYFAMMSAGVGNAFRDLQPWSQVGPSALGFAVMVALALAHVARAGKSTPGLLVRPERG